MKSKNKAPSAPLLELWQSRRLLWQFSVRNLELRHKGTVLGLFWSLLGPLLMLSLYVLVFGIIFGGKLNEAAETETRIEYALGIFLGLAIHHFVAEVLTLSPTAIITNPNFVKKVVFPTSVLPVTTVTGALVHFLISLALIFVGMLIFGLEIQWSLLIWLPVILIPLVITAVGISLGLAAVTIFWRDILQVTPFLSLALLFASAVFYPVAQIPGQAWVFLKFNPLIHWIEESRKVVFWGESPQINHLFFLYGVAGISLLLGSLIFERLRKAFADVL